MADTSSFPIQAKLGIKREYDSQEVEEMIEAIRTGLVDAFVVDSVSGQRVHALSPFETIEELNEILQAIRGGRVDALVVKTPSGDRVFALQGADAPYRVLIETMQEGAATLDADGAVLYANARFAEIIGAPLERVFGVSLYGQLQSADEDKLRLLIDEGLRKTAKGEISFRDLRGQNRHLRLALSPLPSDDGSENHAVCVVATDVTELFEANESLQQLSVRLLQSQDEERRRISRDLHDTTGQDLTALKLDLAAIGREVKKLSPELAERITENVQLAREISDNLRTMSYLLHPPLLDELGLASALRWFVEGFERRSEIKTQLKLDTNGDRLAPELETAIFRMIQEGLTNIHRHSGSSTAVIHLHQSHDLLGLEIQDEGKGIAKEQLAQIRLGMASSVGLQGMRERVKQFGGVLEISSDGHGLRIKALIPLASRHSVQAIPEKSSATSA